MDVRVDGRADGGCTDGRVVANSVGWTGGWTLGGFNLRLSEWLVLRGTIVGWLVGC